MVKLCCAVIKPRKDKTVPSDKETYIKKQENDLRQTKATRNKTIDLSLEESKELIDRCLCPSNTDAELSLSGIVDRTLLGDCFDLLPRLPKNSFDLAVIDPPYNMRKSFNGNVFSKKSFEEYEEYTRRWVSLIAPLMKKNASVYVCCDWESSLVIGKVLSEFFTVRNRITWQREKGRGAQSNWKNGMEDIWFATASDEYTFNLDDVKIKRKVIAPYRKDGKPKDWCEDEGGEKFRLTCPSNFWDDITVPFWSMPENTAHPTQKPEKLLAKLILASSNKGDVVLDPFMGSGSTCVTAKKLGRRFVGIELDEQYSAWAQMRLERAEADKTIQGYSDGVFKERNS